MKCHIFFTVILTLLASSLSKDEPEPEGARLLIAKHINNKYLVENMDVVVKVILFLFNLLGQINNLVFTHFFYLMINNYYFKYIKIYYFNKYFYVLFSSLNSYFTIIIF